MAAPAFFPSARPQIKEILFAMDFSEAALRALPYVALISKTLGARVHLCHIIEPTPLAAGTAAPKLYEAAGKEATERLATLFHSPLLLDVDLRLILAEGAIEEELNKIIREKHIDLVVAGTHGRTGW